VNCCVARVRLRRSHSVPNAVCLQAVHGRICVAKKRYYWSSVFDCVLQEQDGAGNAQVTFTHEPSNYGPLVSENRGGQESQYHFDALGSTRALSNSAQTVTDRFTYDAWGDALSRTGTTTTMLSWQGQHGYYNGPLSTTVQVRYRAYFIRLGRWLSHDPLLYAHFQPPSSYRYAGNTPVSATDPSGLIAITGDLKLLNKCGGYLINFRFALSDNNHCRGFFVQYVQHWTVVDGTCTKGKCCPGCAVQLAIPDQPTEQPFWEFFPAAINDGEATDKDNTDRLGYTDQNGDPNQRGKCGVYFTLFDLRFYCARELKLDDPLKWPVNGSGSSGKLRSKSDEPSFWRIPPVEKVLRSILVIWNCCKCAGDCPVFLFSSHGLDEIANWPK